MGTIITLLALTAISSAQPMPRNLMVRGTECSIYWAGDECVYYKLPKGWTELPSSGNGTIEFKKKKCKLDPSKPEKCCAKLGLKFVQVKLEKDNGHQFPAFCSKR